MTDAARAAAEFDTMGEAYTADADRNAYNRYERLATLALLGDLAGRSVLDAGCAGGGLSALMAARGATVVGVDISPAMIEIARRQPGVRGTFHIADLAQPLDFAADGSFDIVVSSVALHYLRDWEPTLREFRRLLVPGGMLLVSTHHPAGQFAQSPTGNYFATELLTDYWTKGGRSWEVHFYRRPLERIVGGFREAGFELEALHEPQPDPQIAEIDLEAYRRFSTEPWYLWIAARKPLAQA